MEVRKRGPQTPPQNPMYDSRRVPVRVPKIKLPLSSGLLAFIIFLMLFVMAAVIVVEKKLPTGLKVGDENLYPDRFIAQRAMNDLIKLTAIGPRVAGSYENEVIAVRFLNETINDIKSRAKSYHNIEVDIQKSSGGFPLHFLDGMTNLYRDVQSVVVKVGSNMESKHSLLLNCHFDTVSDSPGASDDGAGCAVMLEILRVLTSNRVIKHNVIFLFNGAEENLMQASHGFITQHKWAKEVKAFINLEACGAGGREVLFQAGPDNPWIMETYSDSVPYPYASSLAQEIFESGYIPGDTDFRIFRDFGKVSGLDFAWSANGYVYHTKFDTVSQIPLGSLQRTGDNILALTRGIASGHNLADTHNEFGQPVFFDVLGAVVIRFPMAIAAWIAVVAFGLVAANMLLNRSECRRQSRNDVDNYGFYGREIRRALFATVAGSSLGLIAAGCGAAVLSSLGRSLWWFARPAGLMLYAIIALATAYSLALKSASHLRKNTATANWNLIQIYSDAQSIMWCGLLLLCVALRIRSSFVPLLWVLCPAIAGLIRHALLPQCNDWRRLLLYIIGVGLPFVQSFYLGLGALYMFVPIMGRSGASLPTEIVTALFTCLVFMLVTSCSVPVVVGSNNAWRLVKYMFGIALLMSSLIMLTPLGFPYSADPSAPAPQRFLIVHADRRFHGTYGNSKTVNESYGYWIVDLDSNSPHSVDLHVPEIQDAVPVLKDECHEHLYCGMPYLLPVYGFIYKTHFVPTAAPPQLPHRAQIELLKQNRITEDTERFYLKITGPGHIGLMLSPVPGARISTLNMVGRDGSVESIAPIPGPKWRGNRDTYFIYMAASDRVDEPWLINLDIEHSFVSHEKPRYWLDAAVAGHFLYGPHKMDTVATKFAAKFPAWTATSLWSSSFDSYLL